MTLGTLKVSHICTENVKHRFFSSSFSAMVQDAHNIPLIAVYFTYLKVVFVM